MRNYIERVTSAVKWNGLAVALGSVFHFATLTILARLLSPADFGLVALVMVLMTFALTVFDLGMGVAVIQRQGMTAEELSSFFYACLLLGTIFAAGLYGLADTAALFFKKPGLAPLVKILSPAFVFLAGGYALRTLLEKELNFKKIAMVQLAGIGIYSLSAIFLAQLGYGIRSLIYSLILRYLSEAFLLFGVTEKRPLLRFRFRDLAQLQPFARFVLGERLLNYLLRNLDHIVIGRFLGATALGYYSVAYQIMSYLICIISEIMSKVFLPAFSIIQADVEKLKYTYLKLVKYVSLVSFPFMALLAAMAPETVLAFLGQKWLPMIPVLRVLCYIGAFHSVATFSTTVVYSKGRSDLAFKWTAATVLVMALAFFIGCRWGLLGIVLSYALVTTLVAIAIQAIVNKLLNLPWNEFLSTFATQVVGSCFAVACLFGAKTFVIPSPTSPYLSVIFLSITGLLSYLFIIYRREKHVLYEVAQRFLPWHSYE